MRAGTDCNATDDIAPGLLKRLRRAFQVCLLRLSPRERELDEQYLSCLICAAGLGAVLAVCRQPDHVREIGLSSLAEVFDGWLAGGGSAWVRRGRVPRDLLRVACGHPDVCREMLKFVFHKGLLSKKQVRLMAKSPSELARVLSAGFARAEEEAKREVPKVLNELREALSELQRDAEDLGPLSGR